MEYKFQSLQEAVAHIHGKYGKDILNIVDEYTVHRTADAKLNHVKDHCYKHESSKEIVKITINEFVDYAILNEYTTFKHPMVSAAYSGDLALYIDSFSNTEKMKEFTFGIAVKNDHWNIVQYVVSNFQLKDGAIYWAIRYNKAEMLKKLQDLKAPLYKEWLAYTMYCNSMDVAKELLVNQRLHLEMPREQYLTDWAKKELRRDRNETTRFVKEVLKD